MKSAKIKFTPEEDAKLIQLVKQIGPCMWDTIALSMPGRKGRQCRDRYMNYLSPAVNLDQWTEDEDKMLIEKFGVFGSQWSKISKFFNGRTGSALKNRWNYRLSKTIKINGPKGTQNIINKIDKVSNVNNNNEVKTLCQLNTESKSEDSQDASREVIDSIFNSYQNDLEVEFFLTEEERVVNQYSFKLY